MNRSRRQAILEIISDKRIENQQELVAELERVGIATTQSSVSRDVARLGLIKVNGHYAAPGPEIRAAGPIVSVDTAGECLVVSKRRSARRRRRPSRSIRQASTRSSAPWPATTRC